MTVIQAIVLGIVQGLTEFFPVSSSGHLILAPWLLRWNFLLNNPELNKTFDVALHLGTFVGAAIYFRKDIARYLGAFFRSVGARAVRTHDEKLAWFLILASIPGAAFGAIAEKVIEEHLGQPWLIAIQLAVFGLILYVVDRRSRQDRELDQLSVRDAVWMGVAQAVALSPGVSRSGVTITAGRMRGLTREAAVRFSFLMSLPIIAGAALYKGVKVFSHGGLPAGTAGPFIYGMIASGITGFLAVWFTLRLVRTRPFTIFVLYRVAAAIAILTIIATGFRSATIH